MDAFNQEPYVTGEPDSHCRGCGKEMNRRRDSHPEDTDGEYCRECFPDIQARRAAEEARWEHADDEEL